MKQIREKTSSSQNFENGLRNKKINIKAIVCFHLVHLCPCVPPPQLRISKQKSLIPTMTLMQ